VCRRPARYGIDLRVQGEITSVDPQSREATIVDRREGGRGTETITYDLLLAVPPQSAPDWIKHAPLADAANPMGYVEVDKATHRHVRYPEIVSLGDAGSTPNSKTGAAIRKQAPVVVTNLLAVMQGKEPTAQCDGYASCPITTQPQPDAARRVRFTMKPHPTIPLINLQKERYSMWLLKRRGLPFLYWNLMLRGRA